MLDWCLSFLCYLASFPADGATHHLCFVSRCKCGVRVGVFALHIMRLQQPFLLLGLWLCVCFFTYACTLRHKSRIPDTTDVVWIAVNASFKKFFSCDIDTGGLPWTNVVVPVIYRGTNNWPSMWPQIFARRRFSVFFFFFFSLFFLILEFLHLFRDASVGFSRPSKRSKKEQWFL